MGTGAGLSDWTQSGAHRLGEDECPAPAKVRGILAQTGENHFFVRSTLTETTGTSESRMIRWAVDPMISLPTGERRREPMTIMRVSEVASASARSSSTGS